MSDSERVVFQMIFKDANEKSKLEKVAKYYGVSMTGVVMAEINALYLALPRAAK